MQKGEKDLGVGQTWNLLATSSRFLCLNLVAVDSNRGLMLLLLFFSTSFTFLRDSLVSSILLHYSLWSLLLPQSAEHPLAAAAEVLYDWAIHETKVRRRLCDATTLIYDYTLRAAAASLPCPTSGTNPGEIIHFIVVSFYTIKRPAFPLYLKHEIKSIHLSNPIAECRGPSW